MESLLKQYSIARPTASLVIVQRSRYGDGVAVCRLIERGVYYPVQVYSRRRDAVRALKACGYAEHGFTWSLLTTQTAASSSTGEEVAA